MIQFLITGLLRDRSRSLFPILMVATGAFLTVALYSYMQGVIGDMVDASARFDTGHVKIMTQAYSELADQMPNDLAILENGALLASLKRDYPDMIWAPRIRFGGLVDVPDSTGTTRAQGPALGMGIDMLNPDSAERSLLKLDASLVRGQLPVKSNQILISEAFAEKLDLKPGDAVTLISSTMYGSMSVTNFIVTGTLRFGIVALDKHTIVGDINDIRAALDMEDAASEIVGFRRDKIYADEAMKTLAADFNQKYVDQDDEFAPIMLRLGEQGFLKDIFGIMDSVAEIIIAVFVLAMSIVLWNAGLMNGLRRYGEIGVRLALGESKGGLYRTMIMESVCIGIMGSAVGTALGLALSYYLQYVGMDFTEMFQKSSVMMTTVLRSRVTPISYGIGFIPGLIASVIGTMFAGIGIYRRQTAQLFKELEV